MKIYVDADDYEVYTEKNIDEEIIRRIGVQSEIFQEFKRWILDRDFYEREIDESLCPYAK